MPRLKRIKKGSPLFDLTRPYREDEGPIIYSPEDLVLWMRMDSPSPVDLSNSHLSPTYAGTPVISSNLIGENVYPAATLSDASNINAQVIAPEGQLDMTTAPDGGAPTTSTDIPFSVSVWINQSALSLGTDGIFGKKDAALNFAYLATIDNFNRIVFSLRDDTNNGTRGVRASFIGAIEGEWHHLGFTYNGIGGNLAETGLRIYLDGEPCALQLSHPGTYAGMEPEYIQPLSAGANAIGLSEWTGLMAEFAIWRRELSPTEIKAIYDGTKIPFAQASLLSGPLDNPPRIILNKRDNATGSYPTISRTTGRTETLGNSPVSPYDDTRALVFTDSAPNVHYPDMLRTVDHNKYIYNWVASPNTSGSIVTTGSVRSFVSDQGLQFSIDQRGIGSPRHDLEPYDDSRIYLETTKFYLTGTSPSTYPGFSSPLKDKIQIKIPISSATEALASRFAWNSLINDYGSDGVSTPHPKKLVGFDTEFFEKNHTGFLYYNKDNKRWEEQGITDYATQETNNYTMFEVENDGIWQFRPDDNWLSSLPAGAGSGALSKIYKTYQFSQSTHVGFSAQSYDDLLSLGYHTIGAPTMQGMAPFSRTYHATSSCTFNIADYVTHPFLLEKAVIDIPVLIRRKNGNVYSGKNTWGTPDDELPVDSSLRDIDNYTFFLYCQRRAGSTDGVDTFYDCDNSKRYLVCSGSVAAFNPTAFTGILQDEIDSRGLPHNPAVTVKLTMPISGSDAAGAEAAFTGSIRIEMTPAVPTAQFLGGSRSAIRKAPTNSITTGYPKPSETGTIVIQDFWAGGTTFPSMSFKGGVGYESGHASNIQKNCKWPYLNKLTTSPSTASDVSVPRNDDKLIWAPGMMHTGTRFAQSGSGLFPSSQNVGNISGPPAFQIAGIDTAFIDTISPKPHPLRNETTFKKIPRLSHYSFLNGRTTEGGQGGALTSVPNTIAGNDPAGPIPKIPAASDHRPFRNPIGLMSTSRSTESIDSQIRFGADFTAYGNRAEKMGVQGIPTGDGLSVGLPSFLHDGSNFQINIYTFTGGPISYFDLLNQLKSDSFESIESLGQHLKAIQLTVKMVSALPSAADIDDNYVYVLGSFTGIFGTDDSINKTNLAAALNGNSGRPPTNPAGQITVAYGHYAGDYITGIPGLISAGTGFSSEHCNLVGEFAVGTPDDILTSTVATIPTTNAGQWATVPFGLQLILPSNIPGPYENLPIVFGTEPISTPSPYLLFPGDELVIGLDAGISFVPVSGSNDNSNTSTLSSAVFSKQYSAPPGLPGSGSLCEISGSFLKILPGEASLTLFGSMVTDNKERLFELNQNLTSNNIHEALHFDNPVVDQFQLYSSEEIEGAFIDNIIVGSLGTQNLLTGSIVNLTGSSQGGFLGGNTRTTDPTHYQSSSFPFERGAYGSYGNGGRINYFFQTRGFPTEGGKRTKGFWTSPLYQEKTPASDRLWPDDRWGMRHWNVGVSKGLNHGPSLRFFSISDFSERYFDTLMPDATDYAERSGIQYQFDEKSQIINMWSGLNDEWPSGGIVIEGAGCQFNESSSFSSTTGRVSSNKYAFPYRHMSKPRVISQDITLGGRSTIQNPGSYFNDGSLAPLKIRPPDVSPSSSAEFGPASSRVVYGTILGSAVGLSDHTNPLSIQVHPLINSIGDPVAVNSILFRKGYDFAFRDYFDIFNGPLPPLHLIVPDGGVNIFRLWYNRGPGASHAFSYGIMNTRAQHSQAVFRSDRYGQFRDMLEQRKNGKFFYQDDSSVRPNRLIPASLSSQGEGESDPVVTCYFVDWRDGMSIISPYSTDSSNMSTEATSSCPYIDGIALNRSGTFLGGISISPL